MRAVTGAGSVNALEQRRSAILKANEVRSLRARAKRDLREGNLGLSEALEASYLQTMSVYELLRCMIVKGSRWGHERASGMLADTERRLGGRIGRGRRVGDLTDRQKRALVDACGSTSGSRSK
jgi:hypothetical protein